MKNYSALFSIGILLICMLSGCENQVSDSSQQNNSSVIVPGGRFYSYRLTDNIKDDEEEAWKANRYVGMYLFKERSSEVVEGCANVKYESISGARHFVVANPEKAFVTPEDKSGVQLMGYAPYSEAVTDDIYPLDVANQGDNLQMQFYYASKSDVLYRDHNKTYLEFRPMLSKAVFKVVPYKGVAGSDLEGVAICLDGMNTKGGFNLLTGNFTASSAPVPINLTCETHEAVALLLPSNSVDGYKLTLKTPNMDEKERECMFTDMEGGVARLEPGMQYTFTIEVEPNRMKISVEQTPIGNWGSDGSDQNIGQGGISENYLLTDIQDFATEDFFATKDYKAVTAETWFYRHEEAINAETNFAKIELDPTVNKKVVYFKMPSDANTSAADKGVGYHVTNALRGHFKLQFKAKMDTGSETTEMKCYLRCATKRYIVGLGGNSGTSGVNVGTDHYATYSMSFDFNKTTAATWDNDAAKVKDITDEDLKDVYITFAFNHKAAAIKMYDMKLLKVE